MGKQILLLVVFIDAVLLTGPCWGAGDEGPGADGGYFRYVKTEFLECETPDYKTFRPDYSYCFNGMTIMTGYYNPEDGSLSRYDSEDDYGRRLLCFDIYGDLVYQSRGAMDTWVYRPNFFVSPDGRDVFVLCQLGFEYFYGADVFLISGGSVKYLGRLNVESAREDDPPLVGLVRIECTGDSVEFTFPVEELFFDPGGRDFKIIVNDGFKYIYKDGSLSMTGY